MRQGLPKSIIAKYGITKKAWEVFRGAKPTTHKVVKMPTKKATRRHYGAKPKKSPRSPGLGIGSIKGLLMMAAMLTVGKVAVNKLAPGIPFKSGVSAVAGGGIAAVTGLPGKRLIQYGIADAGSSLIANIVSGQGLNLGAGSSATSGRYDL